LNTLLRHSSVLNVDRLFLSWRLKQGNRLSLSPLAFMIFVQTGKPTHPRRETTRSPGWRGSFEVFLPDPKHDFALDVPTGGTFVRTSRIRQRKRAVDGDAKRTRIEQAA